MGRRLGWYARAFSTHLDCFLTHSRKFFLPHFRIGWQALALISLQIVAASATLGATHVQQASTSNVGGSTFTSISATFSLPTTSGNVIILGVTYGNVNPTITATDSQGNIYVQAIKTYDSGHRQGSAILYALNITGGSSDTVTVKFSSPVAYLAVGIHEYSGIVATAALDGTAGKLGIGKAPSSGAVTTTASGDLIFGTGVEDAIGNGDTFTPGSGLAKRVDLGNSAAYADEDGVQALAGSFAATWNLSPASSWIANLAAFKTSTSSASQPLADPTITSLSPASGPIGATVMITGTNFGQTQGTSIVSFNGLLAAATNWSATAVAATVPNGATTGNVNIMVNGVASNSLQFSVTQISVAVSPASSTLHVGQSQLFTASLQNDTQNRGVSWSVVGSGCSASSCGTLSNVTATSATYTAPASVPSSATITIKATSLSDPTKSNAASVTITSAPLAISVSVNPATTSAQVSTTANFTASVRNDSQNKGVTWSLSGAGCSGTACGTLTNVTATSVTYTAPATVPSPATISLQATSVTDPTRSAASAITVIAAPSISVSLAPTSTSVQVSSAVPFTASVLNDSRNLGVSWSLSGVSCSGASCGTLANQTQTSVTYKAPATAPSTPTVTLTATSNADGSQSASASIAITQPSQTNGVPTFAENHVSGSNTQGNSVSSYILRLPNPSLAGNCIVVGFQYSNSFSVTASIRDDKGDVFTSPIHSSDGQQVVNISYALNVAPGAEKITITFSGGSPNYVSALATEFYNVAPSNALDGSSGGSGTGTSVSAGSFAPTASGDLIYQYAVQDSTSEPMTAWIQGAFPWTLLSADLPDGAAAQYQVQSSSASITPTLSMAPSRGFASIAIALKAANAGTPPPPGIRVVRVQHNSIQPYASSPVRLQFPSTGNLLIVSWIGVPGHDLSSVTDGNGNSYLSTGPAFGYGLSGDNQIFYAASAVTGTTLTGPNLSTMGTDISGSTAVLFDVRGAAAAPYDNTAGRGTASGTLSSSANVAAASISPTTTNGLVISSIGIDSNTIAGVSPGNLLSIVPSPISSPNPVDQNNGWALFYNSAAGPCNFVWSPQGGAVEDWASIAVAFMAAPN